VSIADASIWLAVPVLVAGLIAACLTSARAGAALAFLGAAATLALAITALSAGAFTLERCAGVGVAATGVLALLAGVFEDRARITPALGAIGLGVSLVIVQTTDLLEAASLGAALAAIQIAIGLVADEDGRGAPLLTARLLTILSASAAAIGGAALFESGHAAAGPIAFVGFAGLAGLAPMHGALAETAGRATPAAAACLAVALRLAPLAVAVRLFAGSQNTPDAALFAGLVAGLGALGVVLGAAQATIALDLRRAAAHLFTAQAGLALIVAATGGPAAAAASVFIVGQAAIVCAALAAGPAKLSDLDGLGHSRPAASLVLAGFALALGGAPATAAFLARWLAVEQTLARGWYWAAGLAALAAFAALLVAGRMLGRIYFAHAPSAAISVAALPVIALALGAQLAAGVGGGDVFVALLAAGRTMIAP
jgi:formate hydrogenlyase subunit 3/multisubunit Na+/H+ antiporter MnhD subunit